MDEAEQEARLAETEARLKAMRDGIPDGPGIILDEREAIAVSLALGRLARYEGEDMIGVFMKTSGHLVLDEGELVDLARAIDDTLKRFQRAKTS